MPDLQPVYGGTSVSSTVDDKSWLDLVPGARKAYEYIITQVVKLQHAGREKLPKWRQVLGELSGRVMGSGDAALIAAYRQAQELTLQQSARFEKLDGEITKMLAQAKAAGLGVGPIAVLVAIATTAVVTAAGMAVFFSSDAKNEDAIRQFVDRAVASGVLTAQQAATILRTGSLGSGLGSIGLGLALLAGVWFFSSRRTS